MTDQMNTQRLKLFSNRPQVPWCYLCHLPSHLLLCSPSGSQRGPIFPPDNILRQSGCHNSEVGGGCYWHLMGRDQTAKHLAIRGTNPSPPPKKKKSPAQMSTVPKLKKPYS